VTVCHILGNGSYIEVIFDADALKAHIAHGDLHPVPAGGCPAEDAAWTGGGTEVPDATGGGDTEDTGQSVAEVAGASKEITTEGAVPAENVARDMVPGGRGHRQPGCRNARAVGRVPSADACRSGRDVPHRWLSERSPPAPRC
jgi:hypothetical protein